MGIKTNKPLNIVDTEINGLSDRVGWPLQVNSCHEDLTA